MTKYIEVIIKIILKLKVNGLCVWYFATKIVTGAHRPGRRPSSAVGRHPVIVGRLWNLISVFNPARNTSWMQNWAQKQTDAALKTNGWVYTPSIIKLCFTHGWKGNGVNESKYGWKLTNIVSGCHQPRPWRAAKTRSQKRVAMACKP